MSIIPSVAVRGALILLPVTALAAEDVTSATSSTTAATTAATVPDARVPVDTGLVWLKKHQRADGGWDAATDAAGKDAKDGKGTDETDLIASALATLDFLGAGYDQVTPNRYRPTLASALHYLEGHQQADGGFGSTIATAMITTDLAEAYAMTGDQNLAGPAQRGVDAILARQLRDGPWDDSSLGGWDGTLVLGMCVVALKSSTAAQLHTGNGLELAKTWLTATWQAANPGWKDLDATHAMTDFPMQASAPAAAPTTDAATEAEAIAAVCAIMVEPHHDHGTLLRDSVGPTLTNHLCSPPGMAAAATNAWTAWVGTLATFQFADDRWNQWDASVLAALRSSQHREAGDRLGSWDPVAQGSGLFDGRTAVTALHELALEVDYRRAVVENLSAHGGN